MPTYQTTPLGKWKFPDEIYKRNQKGYGYAGYGHSVERAVPVTGDASPFAAHERQVALDRLHNNHSKMLGMLGALDTTERSQRYTNNASQSQSHKNGRFKEPAYEYSVTAGGLRGGTQKYFYSQEGQRWLDNWRKGRIAQLNAISKDDFSAGRPQRIQVAPEYNELDAVLAQVLDQFEAGAFSSGLLDSLNKLQGAFLRIGSTITSQKLAQYMRILQDLRRSIQRVVADPERTVDHLDEGDDAAELAERARLGRPEGEAEYEEEEEEEAEGSGRRGGRRGEIPAQYRAGLYKLDPKDLKIIKATGLIINRLIKLLDEINRVVLEPVDVRKRVMEEIGSRILGSVAGQASTFGQESTQPRPFGNVARRPTEQRQTLGLPEERETRIAPQRPPADVETLAGRPPVKPF